MSKTVAGAVMVVAMMAAAVPGLRADAKGTVALKYAKFTVVDAVAYKTNLTMRVDSVTFSNGGTYLASGGNVFSLADVLEITA